jgi:hypothetical protein
LIEKIVDGSVTCAIRLYGSGSHHHCQPYNKYFSIAIWLARDHARRNLIASKISFSIRVRSNFCAHALVTMRKRVYQLPLAAISEHWTEFFARRNLRAA